MSHFFIPNSDWQMNRRRNNWLQKIKMKFHISAKNLFLDPETPDDYLQLHSPKDSPIHIRVRGLECIIPVVTINHELNTSHDWIRRPRRRSIISNIRIFLFGVSAKDLFNGI